MDKVTLSTSIPPVKKIASSDNIKNISTKKLDYSQTSTPLKEEFNKQFSQKTGNMINIVI